jgi:hypothetical protein
MSRRRPGVLFPKQPQAPREFQASIFFLLQTAEKKEDDKRWAEAVGMITAKAEKRSLVDPSFSKSIYFGKYHDFWLFASPFSTSRSRNSSKK